jgi:hypothetical protein
MPELRFAVEGATVVPHAATPLLALTVRVENAPPDETLQATLLACQIRIDAPLRGYAPSERDRLRDLFGEADQWHRSLRGLLWTHANATIPPFQGVARVDLHLPCSADLNAGAAKYFYALDSGQIPLTLQFSGTVFYQDGDRLQVARIPWDREATFRLEVSVWKEMMAAYYPNTAFISLRADLFDRLHRYRAAHGLPTWDHAVERLLGPERPS